FERPLNRRKEVSTPGSHLLSGARHHLLRARTCRNEADADFDQTHIGLAGCLHAIAMKTDLSATAERETRRCDDDRHLRVPQSHRGLLELADDEVDVVPVLLLRFE